MAKATTHIHQSTFTDAFVATNAMEESLELSVSRHQRQNSKLGRAKPLNLINALSKDGDKTSINTVRFVPSSSTSILAERREISSPGKAGLEPVMERLSRSTREAVKSPLEDTTKLPKTRSRPELAKKRSQYFEEAFQARPVDPVGDRIRSQSMILAEVKTNVLVRIFTCCLGLVCDSPLIN